MFKCKNVMQSKYALFCSVDSPKFGKERSFFEDDYSLITFNYSTFAINFNQIFATPNPINK